MRKRKEGQELESSRPTKQAKLEIKSRDLLNEIEELEHAIYSLSLILNNGVSHTYSQDKILAFGVKSQQVLLDYAVKQNLISFSDAYDHQLLLADVIFEILNWYNKFYENLINVPLEAKKTKASVLSLMMGSRSEGSSVKKWTSNVIFDPHNVGQIADILSQMNLVENKEENKKESENEEESENNRKIAMERRKLYFHHNHYQPLPWWKHGKDWDGKTSEEDMYDTPSYFKIIVLAMQKARVGDENINDELETWEPEKKQIPVAQQIEKALDELDKWIFVGQEKKNGQEFYEPQHKRDCKKLPGQENQENCIINLSLEHRSILQMKSLEFPRLWSEEDD